MSAVFLHVLSESSDHYHLVFDGPLTDEEAEAAAKAELDFEDPDLLYVQGIVRWPEDLGKIKGP